MKKEDFVYNEKYKYYEKNYDYLTLIVEEEGIDDSDVLEYAESMANNYLANKEKVENFLLDDRLREVYGNDNSDDEILNKIGKPSIQVGEDNSCKIMWFDSKLCQHLITLYVDGNYELFDVTLDG